MRTLVHSLAGVGLLALTTAALAQEAVTLRYQPGKDPLIYRKVSKFKQTQALMGKKFTNSVEQTEVDVWTVTEKDKNALQIKSETKLLLTSMDIGQLGKYTFDSRKDDNEKDSALGAALTPLYERMGNAMLTYTVTPQGKVTKIEGYKELIGDALKDNPIAAQFAGGGSEEAAKMGLAEFIPSLPEKPAAPGTRWETPFQLNLEKLGKATGKRIYHYDGEGQVAKHKTAKISVTTELTFELDIDMGGAKVTGTISIMQSKGTIHFDAKHGHLVSLKNEYTVGGNMNVSAGGKDIPIALEQVQSVAVELLDALPK